MELVREHDDADGATGDFESSGRGQEGERVLVSKDKPFNIGLWFGIDTNASIVVMTVAIISTNSCMTFHAVVHRDRTDHPILFGWSNREELDGRGM